MRGLCSPPVRTFERLTSYSCLAPLGGQVVEGGAMLERLLPERLDNTYRGRVLALWLFGAVLSVKVLQSVMVIFNTSSIARSADGIPLDSFSPAAAQTVVALFALTGFSRLVVLALCVLVLVRYRSAVPFMLGLLAADYLLKQAILHFQPVPSAGGVPGPIVNLAIFVLTLVGLALSLRTRTART
jgi:hypothetical protein